MLGIREDTAATEAYEMAIERWARADDAWQGVTWTLAHAPDTPDSVPLNEAGTVRAYTSDGARSIDMPTLTVVYSFDDEYLSIHEARFTDAKAPFAGRA